MTNTLTLSRRIVAALDPDGTRWPEWKQCRGHCKGIHDCSMSGDEARKRACLNECYTVPDLAAPENLHLLLEVAYSLGGLVQFGRRPDSEYADPQKQSVGSVCGHRKEAPTLSLAVLAAVCAALGIDTTQEDEHDLA